MYEHLRSLAARNVSAEDELSFLGAGMYDHYVPAIIDMLMERSEFLTPYTPYQPEISQGGLQVMFEYQTAISELTGPAGVERLGVRGALGRGRGGLSGEAPQRPRRFVVERRPSPALDRDAQDLRAWLRHGGGRGSAPRRRHRPATPGRARSTRTRAPRSSRSPTSTAPSRTPRPERGGQSTRPANGAGDAAPVVVCQVDPITLGVLAPPGECGVDVAVGEGQALGNRLDFGGPSFGLFAAREEYLRRMPGRIAGETVDVDGRRGFVLTLQTREQHIRREKATSNICTAQALNALAGVVYLSWLGRRGIAELGELLLARTHYARETLAALDGVEKLHSQPVIREFAVRLDADVEAVCRRCAADGRQPRRRP